MKLIVPAILCVLLLSIEAKSQPGNGNSTDRKFLRAKLYTAAGVIADGNMVAFDDDYSNGYDGHDAIKMMNPGENFGMRRDGRILAGECRNVLSETDTIYYDTRNLAPKNYYIRFTAQHFQGTIFTGILKDKFTGSVTPVSLTDTVYYNFNVTSDPASKAFDRFTLFFTDLAGMATLPVKFKDVTLNQLNKTSVGVNWKTEQELNVKQYDVERSFDGTVFTKLGSVAPHADPARKGSYSFEDVTAGNSTVFYRVIALDIDGKKTVSKVVKTAVATSIDAQFSAWPNPLTTEKLQVKLSGMPKGNYSLSVISLLGQKVHSAAYVVTQADMALQVSLNSQVANGQYLVTLTGERGEMFQQKLLIKR